MSSRLMASKRRCDALAGWNQTLHVFMRLPPIGSLFGVAHREESPEQAGFVEGVQPPQVLLVRTEQPVRAIETISQLRQLRNQPLWKLLASDKAPLVLS